MRKVLDDSARAISLLQAHPQMDASRIGIVGHSYGGNTVLFHAALDERIRFACSSGAACSYHYKMTHQIGIEMAEAIPGFAAHFDIADLLVCMASRRVLLLSATEDAASQDADVIVSIMQEQCARIGLSERVEHKRYQGEHALTPERFDAIVHWLMTCAAQKA
jgi:dienelactone hydrolase